jgi:cbb3-type cytochrome oxidase maturation protein
MESLYLLIPLSVLLVLAIGGLLVWAAMSGQFEGLDDEGRRILDDDDVAATGGERRDLPGAGGR